MVFYRVYKKGDSWHLGKIHVRSGGTGYSHNIYWYMDSSSASDYRFCIRKDRVKYLGFYSSAEEAIRIAVEKAEYQVSHHRDHLLKAEKRLKGLKGLQNA